MQFDANVNSQAMTYYNGPTFEMKLPEGWQQTSPHSVVVPFRHISRFSPASNERISVQVMTSVILLAEKTSHSLRSVLSAPGHELTADELNSIAQVLGNASDHNISDPRHSFDLYAASTGELNGRMAVMVEGRWCFGEKARFCGVFIPVDETFRKVDRVYLECPAEQYIKMRNEFLLTLASVKWHKLI
jgi:hypothetical protein